MSFDIGQSFQFCFDYSYPIPVSRFSRLDFRDPLRKHLQLSDPIYNPE